MSGGLLFVKIRFMRLSDVPAIVKIQEAVTRRKVSKEFGKKVRSFVKKGGGLSLVAEVGGEVAGYIVGDIKTWGFGVEESGWIEMVGVHPGSMGHGVGKKLGGELLKNFRAKGISSVHTTARWDWGDMLAFFKSLGFEQSEFINLEKTLRR